jgi:purine nucleosidase
VDVHLITGNLILVAVGPLTNLALSLHLDPNLHEKIPQLIIMGGNTTGLGQ